MKVQVKISLILEDGREISLTASEAKEVHESLKTLFPNNSVPPSLIFPQSAPIGYPPPPWRPWAEI